MRRPLLFGCLCVVLITALRYYGRMFPDPGGPPDAQEIFVTGKIYQKSDSVFYLKILDSAADLRQDDLLENQPTENREIKDTEVENGRAENGKAENGRAEDGKSENRKIENGISDRLICNFEDAGELTLGSVVTVRGNFDAFDRATNPGEFDYESYYRSCGFTGRLKDTQILSCKEPLFQWKEALHDLRSYWERRLYRIFPEKEASVMAAILLGNKSDVDSDIKELYRRNGMIHILSISGVHITLIGMGIYRLLRRIGLPVWLSAIGGGIFLILYGVMTGLSISACRAIGMYLLRMLAHLCGRTYDLLTALGVTAAVLLVGNPAYLENMGFLLSFGSVLGVGALLPALADTREEEWVMRKQTGKQARLDKTIGRLVSSLRQGMLAGCSVTLTTLPIQLWFAYEIPVYSVLLNVLILPFMSVVMIAGLIAMLIPGLGVVGIVDRIILAGYEKLCRLFARLPFHTWNPGRPAVWQMAVYFALWFLVVAGTERYRQLRMQRNAGKWSKRGEEALRVVKGMKYMVLIIAVLIMGIRIPQGDRVTFLDVGQGDCICVQLSSGEVYIFDCGSSNRRHIGEKVLIPFLKYQGIRSVDAVFLSHADADHTNGIIELLRSSSEEGIHVRQIVLPWMAEEQIGEEFAEILAAVEDSRVVTMMRAGDAWQVGLVKEPRQVPEGGEAIDVWQTRFSGNADSFLCLHPAGNELALASNTSSGNADSQCFFIRLKEGENELSILLTGDVESEGERELLEELRRRQIAHVTVLKVAHHGSRGATSQELLEQTAPDVAVISCGRNNRYKHPHSETLERLGQAGAHIYRTDESGAISVYVRRRQAIMKVFYENKD